VTDFSFPQEAYMHMDRSPCMSQTLGGEQGPSSERHLNHVLLPINSFSGLLAECSSSCSGKNSSIDVSNLLTKPDDLESQTE
jgi:hypothetical protein